MREETSHPFCGVKKMVQNPRRLCGRDHGWVWGGEGSLGYYYRQGPPSAAPPLPQHKLLRSPLPCLRDDPKLSTFCPENFLR